MAKSDSCRYFIVKHDLKSFEALPNFIWSTHDRPGRMPHGYGQIRRGDRWISFAYTTSDQRERPLSLITGFYECTQEKADYRDIPAQGLAASEGRTEGWMIEGKPYGEQPGQPVGVRPIGELLGKKVFNQQAIIRIEENDFERIRKNTLRDQLKPEDIPVFGREPRNEQELLAVVVGGHKEWGIEQIVRVQKAFPDLLVKLEGRPEEVYLELEVYSKGFSWHGHDKCVGEGLFPNGADEKADRKPVAVLCWIHNEKGPKLKQCVHGVYELQALIREGKKIRW